MRRSPDFADYARRLGGELHGDRIQCPGPGHSSHDRSLSVLFRPDGTFTAYSFANDDWQTFMDHIRVLCGLPLFEGREERTTAAIRPKESHNRRIEEASSAQIARSIWNEAVPADGTLVETYLRHRNLFLPADAAGRTIRFHANCPFRGEHGDRRFLPAMIARYSPIAHDLEPEAPPTAIHRTALKADGSRHLGKQMLGPVRGQCVKLSPDEDVTEGLHLAEGIETSLAILIKGFAPMWAATTAGCMKSFPVLAGIHSLTLFADNDANSTGFDAAADAANRWKKAGQEARIIITEEIGTDFADFFARKDKQ